MNLKDDLIKLGNRNPNLRDDIRPVLQHVVREDRMKRQAQDALPRKIEDALLQAYKYIEERDDLFSDREYEKMRDIMKNHNLD